MYRIEPNLGGGLVGLELWAEQRRLVGVMEGQRGAGQPVRVCNLKTRRAGTSTVGEAWRFHWTHWTERTRSLVVAHDDETTDVLAGISRLLYDELPVELKQPLRRYNKRMMEFGNRSQMQAATAGYVTVGRGRTLQHLHISEVDFCPDPPGTLAGLRETIANVAGTSVLIESTAASGDGWLSAFWKACKAGTSGYVPVFTPARLVPGHRRAVPEGFEPTEEERALVQRFGVSREYLAWRRHKCDEFVAAEPWGGERRFRREYPDTDEEAFVHSGACIFPDVVLARLREGVTAPARAYQVVQTSDYGFEAFAVPIEDATLWVWKQREAERSYVFGIDVADGIRKTESVIQVFAWPGYEQVAEFASNQIAPDKLALVARWLATRYGGEHGDGVLMVPEVNKSGILFLYILQQLPGAFEIFRWRYFDKPGMRETNDPRLGWETHDASKGILAQVGNLLYLRGDGLIRSAVLYEQMRRCVDLVPGVRWRTEGRSDRVLAALIAQTGAYLDLEGGVVHGMGAVRDEGRDLQEAARGGHRERSSYDGDADEALGGGGLEPSAYLNRGDVEDV